MTKKRRLLHSFPLLLALFELQHLQAQDRSTASVSTTLPAWADGWHVTGVIKLGRKTEASLEHRDGAKRFVREGDQLVEGVDVIQISRQPLAVTLRNGEQTATIRTRGAAVVVAAAKRPSFTTALKVRLSSGETVAFGGWSTADGRRIVAFGTPTIDEKRGHVSFSMKFMEAPEGLWDRVDLGSIKSQGAESSQYSTFDSTRRENILKTASTAPSVDVLSAPSITTADNHRAEITIGDLSVRTVPSLTADRRAVDLSLEVEVPAPMADGTWPQRK